MFHKLAVSPHIPPLISGQTHSAIATFLRLETQIAGIVQVLFEGLWMTFTPVGC